MVETHRVGVQSQYLSPGRGMLSAKSCHWRKSNVTLKPSVYIDCSLSCSQTHTHTHTHSFYFSFCLKLKSKAMHHRLPFLVWSNTYHRPIVTDLLICDGRSFLSTGWVFLYFNRSLIHSLLVLAHRHIHTYTEQLRYCSYIFILTTIGKTRIVNNSQKQTNTHNTRFMYIVLCYYVGFSYVLQWNLSKQQWGRRKCHF